MMTETELDKASFITVPTVYTGSTEYKGAASCGQWAVGISMAINSEDEMTEYRVSGMLCTKTSDDCPSESAIQDFSNTGGSAVLLVGVPESRHDTASIARQICNRAVHCKINC